MVLTLYNNFLMNITDIHQRFDCENELLAQGILPLILVRYLSLPCCNISDISLLPGTEKFE